MKATSGLQQGLRVGDVLHCKSPCARRVRRKVCRVQAIAAPVREETGSVPNATQFTQDLIAEEKKYVMQTYARPELVFTHGEGARLYDAHGKEYLDFAAGIAVNALGHSDPRWLEAVVEQAGTLAHTSNLFHSVPQVRLAKRLVEQSFADKVFYANSGTEANEAAIKFSRKHARLAAGVDPYDAKAEAPHEMVSFTGSFHGRTLGALALTYKDAYKIPFAPGVPGARMVKYLDLDAAAAVIQKGKTAAVFVEPIQGEGGIFPANREFLQGLRDLCDEAGALLVFDEVQCGLGRTGKLFGYQNFDVEPDILTLAKPLAGGLPIGAVLVKQHVADSMKPGDHGSTFAGNPLVTRAAETVVDIISEPAFLQSVIDKGERLRSGLAEALKGNEHVKEIRGLGLITGIQLDQPAGGVVTAARDEGLIVITAGAGDVVRLVPPLNITNDDVDLCISILSSVLNSLQNQNQTV
ncbi:g5789 [Coccomyxa viridis]|uniref:acetylornithine transaminase n=1 Tax=Coccomyxa viridis TaxID=1274662 RepID=A0ABP1FTR4_9CHLO